MPTGSYQLESPQVDLGSPILLHGLSGFMDAGASARLAVEHVLANTEHHRVATFDIDAIFDYRARRPRTVFDADHYELVDMPELAIDWAVDEHGERFLILHGVEPDLAWDVISRELVSLIRRLHVRLAVGVHAIPWPAPHTRPISVTAHANDRSLIPGNRPWVGAIEVPGSLSALLELRLGQAGVPALGFAAHIPHYLVQADFPRGSVALLESVASATGLALPLRELRRAAEESDADIGIQIATNVENMEAVASLEAQHDALIAARAGSPDGEVASYDDIAAQVEAFLANLDGREQP